MRSDQTNVERFIYLYMKIDLHLTDFREMRLKLKGDFYIAYYAVMGTDLNAYLRKFMVFLSQAFGCANFMADN